MKSRKFRLLLGLFFAVDGIAFLAKAILKGEAFYGMIAAVWLVAAALILASCWFETRAKARR